MESNASFCNSFVFFVSFVVKEFCVSGRLCGSLLRSLAVRAERLGCKPKRIHHEGHEQDKLSSAVIGCAREIHYEFAQDYHQAYEGASNALFFDPFVFFVVKQFRVLWESLGS